MIKSTIAALLFAVAISTTSLAFAQDSERDLLTVVYEYENGEKKIATDSSGDPVAMTWRECRDMGGWKVGNTCIIRMKGVP